MEKEVFHISMIGADPPQSWANILVTSVPKLTRCSRVLQQTHRGPKDVPNLQGEQQYQAIPGPRRVSFSTTSAVFLSVTSLSSQNRVTVVMKGKYHPTLTPSKASHCVQSDPLLREVVLCPTGATIPRVCYCGYLRKKQKLFFQFMCIFFQ